MTMSAIVQVIPQAILDAALALHQRNNRDLTYGLPSTAELDRIASTPLWCCAGGEIKFTNLEARNHCAAFAIFEHLTSLRSTDALFDAAHELRRNEIGHPDSASGRLLGFASETVNVLMEAAQVIRNKQHQGGNTFRVLHLIEVALPHLTGISSEAVVAVVEAQHESTKGDMAVGVLFNAIEDRLRSEPQIAWDIWHLTRDNMSESMQSLYSTALQALMHTDQQSLALERAREDADAIDSLIAATALWTLGRAIHVHKLNGSDLDECIAVLASKTNAASTEIKQAATRAVAHASLKDQRLMSELVRLSVRPDDYILAVIADFLFMNQQDLPVLSPDFETLLKALVGLLPSQKNAIRNFDWVLHQVYATPKFRPLVLDCLSQWLIHHGDSSMNDEASIELFDQTVMQIANDKPQFQAVITRWLVAPEKQLAVAFGGLISYFHIRGLKSPTFSSEVLNSFGLQDFRLLARRLLGYVISEEPLLALTFSLLETNDASKRTYGWVYALLTEDVGRDFPHATMEALKVRLQGSDSPEKDFLLQIYDILLQRSTVMDDLPRLQELRPPMRLQRTIRLNRAREMERATDVADEKSIIRSVVTSIPMKAGMGWFSVLDSKVGPTQRLQNFSYSISLPKRSLTDPVGYSITRLHYRIAKRDDE